MWVGSDYYDIGVVYYEVRYCGMMGIMFNIVGFYLIIMYVGG